MTTGSRLRVVVTGGASGIGLAIARAFAGQGSAVGVIDRPSRLPDGLIPDAEYRSADVTDEEAIRRAVDSLAAQFNGLDTVVNNAGVGAQGDVTVNDDAEWHRVLDVNVVGAARMCRAAWPYLVDSPRSSIVFVASIAATTGLPNRVLYSASKGAVLAMTRAIAADGLEHGIRANAVCPGTVDTPWVGRLLEQAADAPAERAALVARQPHGRLVTPEEVADAVLYLASPASGSTNGTALAVDGGMAGLRVPPVVRA